MENLTLTPMKDWGLDLEERMNISGPCSAETQEQVMETARGVARHDVQVIRAGIWKPRTRPNSFEGVGSVGLKWLKDAGKELNKPVCCEVANVKHVYEALRGGIDILWIGARTTVNPFAVQEIADALDGVDIPVMVKNPVNPDLNLWIGAFERLNKKGITKLAAIHRGFSVHTEDKYRNNPMWQIPIELKRMIPDMPIICDPSHICGNRHLLKQVSQKALDLDFDGLMLESHINPDKALSDAKQQVTPERLGEILKSLTYRELTSDNPEFRSHLEHLREEIDELDHKLIEQLSERMKIAKQIGVYKKENNITILQPGRWEEIISDRVKYGMDKGLSDDILGEILKLIHQESIRHQNRVMNEESEAVKEMKR